MINYSFRLLYVLLALACAALACSAPVPRDPGQERVATLKKQLQGEWACIKMVCKESKLDLDLSHEAKPTHTVSFSDSEVTFTSYDKERSITRQSVSKYSLTVRGDDTLLVCSERRIPIGRDISPLNYLILIDANKQLDLKFFFDKMQPLKGVVIDLTKEAAREENELYAEAVWTHRRLTNVPK